MTEIIEVELPKYEKQADYAKGLKTLVIDLLGGKCAACGMAEQDVLQLDHIHGGGNRERTTFGRGYRLHREIRDGRRNDIRLLCPTCNIKARLYGPDHTKWNGRKAVVRIAQELKDSFNASLK